MHTSFPSSGHLSEKNNPLTKTLLHVFSFSCDSWPQMPTEYGFLHPGHGFTLATQIIHSTRE
jgi:hypothetical protein